MKAGSRQHPKVSIGLPVYNGERYLSSAIESLLGQTFQDFELIICDNASTDGTEAICRGFARDDKRVRYHRNAQNIGAAANFNLAFKFASGEYFKWASHDDICAPDFLLKCLEVMEKDASAVLCSTEVTFIDESGRIVEIHDNNLKNVNSPEAYIRFADLTSINHWCFDIFGLIRSDALKRTPLIASYVGSDRNALVVLGLMGRFHRIPECLFFSRDHGERSIKKYDLASRAEWFDPRNRGKIVFPHWRILVEFIKTVSRVELSLKQRAACYQHLARWLSRNSRLLVRDVKVGAKYGINRFWKHRKRELEM